MTSLWQYSKKSALMQSIVVTTICFLAYLTGPISTYETNDDVYYNLILAGKLLTSSPDPHVVNLNYVLASIFTKLYTAIPDVPWYAFFHIASIGASVFFLNYCFSIARNNSKFFTRLLVSLTTALPFLIYIQFTKTSLVLATTGYLGIYLINEAELRSRLQSVYLHATAVLFLVLSFSLRKDSFFLATLLCSLLIIRAILKKKMALISALSVMVACFIVFGLIQKQNYDASWQKAFMQWVKVIGPIIDYDLIRYDENTDVFTKAGWSKNDYYFLKAWAFVDDKVYGQKQIDYIYENARKREKSTQILPTLKGAVTFPATNYILTTTGLALLFLLIYRHRYRLVCIQILIPVVVCIGILGWQGRFPTRVSTSIAYCLPWMILVVAGEFRKRSSSVFISIVALLALAVPLYRQYLDLTELSAYRRAQNYELRHLGALAQKTPFTLVTLGASFPYEGILPFESPDYLSKIRFVWLSSMNQTPIQKKQMTENQIDDVFASLVTNNKILITFDPSLTGFLRRYMVEHYQNDVTVDPVYTGRSFALFRLIGSTQMDQKIQ